MDAPRDPGLTVIAAPPRFGSGSAELAATAALGRRLGLDLGPRRLRLDDGTSVEVEAGDDAGRVVAQFVLNTGAVRSSLRNKVAADLFKLVWIRQAVAPGARAILVVSDSVSAILAGRGWLGAAARDLGVEVVVLLDDGTTKATTA